MSVSVPFQGVKEPMNNTEYWQTYDDYILLKLEIFTLKATQQKLSYCWKGGSSYYCRYALALASSGMMWPFINVCFHISISISSLILISNTICTMMGGSHPALPRSSSRIGAFQPCLYAFLAMTIVCIAYYCCVYINIPHCHCRGVHTYLRITLQLGPDMPSIEHWCSRCGNNFAWCYK